MLNRYTVKSRIEGSNPSVSAIFLTKDMIFLLKIQAFLFIPHINPQHFHWARFRCEYQRMKPG